MLFCMQVAAAALLLHLSSDKRQRRCFFCLTSCGCPRCSRSGCPALISNQNQSIQLRKSIQRVYRCDLGSFFNSFKCDVEKINLTYFLFYFPWQIKFALLPLTDVCAAPFQFIQNTVFGTSRNDNTTNIDEKRNNNVPT